jgi:hypothetical protein
MSFLSSSTVLDQHKHDHLATADKTVQRWSTNRDSKLLQRQQLLPDAHCGPLQRGQLLIHQRNTPVSTKHRAVCHLLPQEELQDTKLEIACMHHN